MSCDIWGSNDFWTIAIHQSYHVREFLRHPSSIHRGVWPGIYGKCSKKFRESLIKMFNNWSKWKKQFQPMTNCSKHIFGLSEFIHARPEFTRWHLCNQWRQIGKSIAIFCNSPNKMSFPSIPNRLEPSKHPSICVQQQILHGHFLISFGTFDSRLTLKRMQECHRWRAGLRYTRHVKFFRKYNVWKTWNKKQSKHS